MKYLTTIFAGTFILLPSFLLAQSASSVYISSSIEDPVCISSQIDYDLGCNNLSSPQTCNQQTLNGGSSTTISPCAGNSIYSVSIFNDQCPPNSCVSPTTITVGAASSSGSFVHCSSGNTATIYIDWVTITGCGTTSTTISIHY